MYISSASALHKQRRHMKRRGHGRKLWKVREMHKEEVMERLVFEFVSDFCSFGEFGCTNHWGDTKSGLRIGKRPRPQNHQSHNIRSPGKTPNGEGWPCQESLRHPETASVHVKLQGPLDPPLPKNKLWLIATSFQDLLPWFFMWFDAVCNAMHRG